MSQRIGFYTTNFAKTGGNKRILFLAGELSNLGFEVDVVVPEILNEAKFKRYFSRIIPAEEALGNRYHLLIGMNPRYTSLKEFKEIDSDFRAIYILHEFDPNHNPKYQKWIQEFSDDENFMVFANNPAWKKHYQVDKKVKTFDLVGGFDHESWDFDLKRAEPDTFQFICNFNHMEWKGTNEVLRAIGKAKIGSFKILGFGSRLLNFWSDHRLNLQFNVPFQEMQKIYSQGSLYIYFEDQNAGWGNTAFESLMSGLPFICTEHGTQSFARHLDNAFVVPRKLNALISAIEFLYHDTQTRESLVLSSEKRKSLAKKYSYQSLARKIQQILQKQAVLCS